MKLYRIVILSLKIVVWSGQVQHAGNFDGDRFGTR